MNPDERLARWSKVGITIQFLALVRTLAEFFRLRLLHGTALTLSAVEPFISRALIAALLCWLAVTLFFFRRYASTLVVSFATVVLLLTYKFLVIG